jgi:hypothetical protein
MEPTSGTGRYPMTSSESGTDCGGMQLRGAPTGYHSVTKLRVDHSRPVYFFICSLFLVAFLSKTMARISCWIHTHSYYLGVRLCAVENLPEDAMHWNILGRKAGSENDGQRHCLMSTLYTSDGITGCNCNLRLICFSSSSSFSPFYVKIQRMSLCRSMYNHTTSYGDMFI